MDILAWTLFGVVNGLILYLFESKKNKKKIHLVTAITLGAFGALSGGTLAYLLFGGAKAGCNSTLLLTIAFEALLLYFLVSGKNFKKA